MGKINLSPVAIVTGVLAVIFCPVFQDDIIIANNDGPFGGLHSAHSAYPDCISSVWNDLNYLGSPDLASPAVSFSAAVRLPGVLFLVFAIGAIFALFYDKKKHFKIYRACVFLTLIPFCSLILCCCLYPLATGDDYYFYKYPWMFSLAPLLFNGLILFGITQITHEIQND